MRLTSIGVLLFSLWSQITTCRDGPCQCGYNHKLYSVSYLLSLKGKVHAEILFDVLKGFVFVV